MSPVAPESRGGRARVRNVLVLLAGGALALSGVALVLPQEGEPPLRPTSLGTLTVAPANPSAVAPVPT
ncbi:hypothetical protein ACLESO_37375, partial [Pyxidicoccus sp. 3LG]